MVAVCAVGAMRRCGATSRVDRVDHDGWSVEARRAPLGVVGFVFEGRPNVFADATGVLRTGNTVVMRIGSDALRHGRGDRRPTPSTRRSTPRACPPGRSPSSARRRARPAGRCSTIGAWPSPSRAGPGPPSPSSAPSPARPARRSASTARAGRGSSPACVADPERFRLAVLHSLDRKVCNTLNVCCIPPLAPTSSTSSSTPSTRPPARHVGPAARRAARSTRAGERSRRSSTGRRRARRAVATRRPASSAEWEWEHSPEVSLVVTADVDRGGRAVQPLQPAVHRLPRQRRSAPSTTGSTTPSTPRSSATASPAGSTASTPSTHPSSGCRTGRAAACSAAAACCPAPRCTPSATAPASPTPTLHR